jgi:TetR/AcrR family transcriptional repressor of nem operon
LTDADQDLRLALGRFFERWTERLAPHAPETAHASARERTLATIALCVGGVTIARALRGQPLSDEVLRACETWAVPERAPRATASSSRRPPPRRRRRPARP